MNEQRYPIAINVEKSVTLYTIDCRKLEIASYYRKWIKNCSFLVIFA